MLDDWEEVVAVALALPGTELGSYYRQPAVIVPANGRAFLSVGHAPETSFVLHFDAGTAGLLKETAPDTFWQSPHYQGTGALLVRYGDADSQRVTDAISRSRDHVARLKPPRRR